MGRTAAPGARQGSTAAAPRSADEALGLLRARGGRVTASRRLLLEALFDAEGHLSAEELAADVHRRAPDVHLSTIYRNLEELEALGVVAHTHVGHGAATYQLTASAHGHFLCESCGEMLDAPDAMFRDLRRAAKSTLGFSIDPGHVAILGRCAACTET